MSKKVEQHLVDIIRAFLDTDESRTAGVPAIPVRKMDDLTDAVTPRLAVVAEVEGEGGSRTVTLHVNLHSVLGTDRGQTTSDQAATWISAVEARCKDKSALNTHFAAQPLEARTGYQVLKLSYPAPPDIDRESEGDVIMRTTLRFACRV